MAAPPDGSTPDGSTPVARPGSPDATPVAPTVADGVPVRYLDPAASWAASEGAVPGSRLVPGVVARVRERFDETKADLVHDQEYEAVLMPIPDSPRPEDFRSVDGDDRDLLEEPPAGARHELAPSAVATKTWWTKLQRDLREHLYRSMTLEIPSNAELRLYGRVGESPEESAGGCRAAATDGADQQIAALAAKYERRITSVERHLLTAQQAADRQREARTSTRRSATTGRTGPSARRPSARCRSAWSARMSP
jgi:hypothetical protein